jgi:tRNA A-37 threonylcarbamoyl transferase component Bud32
MRPPDGFVAVRTGTGELLCRADLADAAVAMGLDQPAGWHLALRDAAVRGPGRGATARVALVRGPVVIVKQMRRGGLLAPAWGQRFVGRRRLRRNVTVPLEAIRRGVPTPSPVALLVVPGPAGLFRAWLAVEAIEGAIDLVTRLRDPNPADDAEVGAALRAVRLLHDAGIVHPDLNLGNLMTRPEGRGWATFIVDLDRASARDGPLGFGPRQAALRRIERSYRKEFPCGGPLGPGAGDTWYREYAGGDAALLARLERGRRVGGAHLALHRLGWNWRGGRTPR